MKGITLTQPWATLCMLPARGLVGKRYETRSWSTSYRGPLAIHAAKGFPAHARNLCATEPFRSTLAAAGITSPEQLLRGVILGTVQLVECWRIWDSVYLLGPGISSRHIPTEPELSFGDYTPGRSAWEFGKASELVTPMPWKGRLGLFEVQMVTNG